MAKTNKFNQTKKSVIIIAIVCGIVAGYGLHSLQSSFAAPRSRTGGGSCYASPNPTPLRSTFTVNFSGMPANSIVGIYTQDTQGTGWVSASTDSSGNGSAPDAYTAYAGVNTITIKSTGKKPATLATCNVTVQ